MAGPEAKVEAALTRYVKAAGGLSYKLAPTVPGLPDRLIIMPGGLMSLVEVKAKTGRLSPAQEAMHAAMGLRGVNVSVIWSNDEAKALVDRLSAAGDVL